jgi:hypothetical protein
MSSNVGAGSSEGAPDAEQASAPSEADGGRRTQSIGGASASGADQGSAGACDAGEPPPPPCWQRPGSRQTCAGDVHTAAARQQATLSCGSRLTLPPCPRMRADEEEGEPDALGREIACEDTAQDGAADEGEGARSACWRLLHASGRPAACRQAQPTEGW